MNKIIYVLGILLIFSGCKFTEKSYTSYRENSEGSFRTLSGSVKYITGSKDELVKVLDINAVVEQKLSFVKRMDKDGKQNLNMDSILVIGHCWSEKPNPTLRDTTYTKFFIGGSKPTKFLDTLKTGSIFVSDLRGLQSEKKYYVRAYVITGNIEAGEPVYKDTAYNFLELEFETISPEDVWEIPADGEGNFAFTGNYEGAIAFEYGGKIYAGLGRNEFSGTAGNGIYALDPTAANPSWALVTSYPNNTLKSRSNCVAFVMSDVRVGLSTKTYVYIGLGSYIESGVTKYTNEIYRWEPSTGIWTKLSDGSEFKGVGTGRENAIAFTIKIEKTDPYSGEIRERSLAYVGLGNRNSIIFNDVLELDPEKVTDGHLEGTWTDVAPLKINALESGITKAVAFSIGENGYVCCGEDEDGNYLNDLWMFSQTIDGYGSWIKRSPFPGTPRIDLAAFSTNIFGYVGTGFDGDSCRSDFYRYDLYTNRWNAQVSFHLNKNTGAKQSARRGAVGVGLKVSELDYRGFFGMGITEDGDYKDDFWQYRPDY